MTGLESEGEGGEWRQCFEELPESGCLHVAAVGGGAGKS